MATINKCPECKKYTMKKSCPKCNTETKSAHYKFVKIRDAPKGDFKRR